MIAGRDEVRVSQLAALMTLSDVVILKLKLWAWVLDDRHSDAMMTQDPLKNNMSLQ